MAGFTKLHQAILHSSVWSQPHYVRVVWVSMLAMANADGVVEASTSGLARAANVSLEECRQALELLMGPDDESRDGTSGERVSRVEGGFYLLNYANYRDRQTKQQAAAADRMRKKRAEKRGDGEVRERSRTFEPVTPCSTEAEAEAEAEAEKKKARKRAAPPPARPSDVEEQVWEDWKTHRQRKNAIVSKSVLDGLRKEAKKAKLTLQEAMLMQVTNGWQGFQAAWVDRLKEDDKPKGYTNVPGGISADVVEAARRTEERWRLRDQEGQK